ncbi:hypothetical protein C8Q79DRAFT_334756 [Trametes meyenii]|nr:hypothetical protein C8Q79DRAFT_334756 [Trametes meyenii]
MAARSRPRRRTWTSSHLGELNIHSGHLVDPIDTLVVRHYESPERRLAGTTVFFATTIIIQQTGGRDPPPDVPVDFPFPIETPSDTQVDASRAIDKTTSSSSSPTTPTSPASTTPSSTSTQTETQPPPTQAPIPTSTQSPISQDELSSTSSNITHSQSSNTVTSIPSSNISTQRETTGAIPSAIISTLSVSGTNSTTTILLSALPISTAAAQNTGSVKSGAGVLNIGEIVAICVACVSMLASTFLGCWAWRRRKGRRKLDPTDTPTDGAEEAGALQNSATAFKETTTRPVSRSVSLPTQEPPVSVYSEGDGTRDAVILSSSVLEKSCTVVGARPMDDHSMASPRSSVALSYINLLCPPPSDLRSHLPQPSTTTVAHAASADAQPRESVARPLPTSLLEDGDHRSGGFVREGLIQGGWDRGTEVNSEPPPEYSRY